MFPAILRSARVLIVTAHPDDESYTAAGTIHAIHKHGGKLHLVCATRGERGSSHVAKPLTQSQLGTRRAQELKKACRVLGISSHTLLRLPDGKVMAHQDRFLSHVQRAAKTFKPDFIMTFGPDGVTGHHDHVAAGQVSLRVAQTLDVPLLLFTFPPRVAKQAQTFLRNRRRASTYLNTIKYQAPTTTISISRSVKMKALRCHASQMDRGQAFTGFPAFAVKELLQRECFVLIRPK